MGHRLGRRTTAVALSLSLAGVVLGAGCGADHGASASTATTATPAQSGAVQVAAVDNNFRDESITITAGSTVTWTNDGRNDHNVTPVEGSAYGVGTDGFKPGASYTATFATPGTYHYFCSIHGTTARGMVGTVQVVAP